MLPKCLAALVGSRYCTYIHRPRYKLHVSFSTSDSYWAGSFFYRASRDDDALRGRQPRMLTRTLLSESSPFVASSNTKLRYVPTSALVSASLIRDRLSNIALFFFGIVFVEDSGKGNTRPGDETTRKAMRRTAFRTISSLPSIQSGVVSVDIVSLQASGHPPVVISSIST